MGIGVIASFLAVAIVSERASEEIDSLSDNIAYNSAPSIERLAGVRAAAQDSELTLWRFMHAKPADRPALSRAVDASRAKLDEEVQGYLELPTFRGEHAYWRRVRGSADAFDDAVQHTRDVATEGQGQAAAASFVEEVEPSARRVVDASIAAIEFNAQNGRDLARRIKDTRHQHAVATGVLAAWSVLLVALGILLVRRRIVGRRASLEAHAKELETLSAELEMFAGRVAHDLRNPLSVARLAAELIVRATEDDKTRVVAVRGLRSLTRADAIIGGIREFARSGAKPDPGARTDLREVVADFLGGIGAEAEREGTSLACEDLPAVLVACSPGVYLSLIGNLVRNALKHMGPSPVRRVVVRARDEGAVVRTEVEDTGPGIAPEDLPYLFDLYYRGRRSSAPGIGFGLATVKRLVEAHHGSAGVVSRPGQGSTFWFTLRHAGAPEPLAEVFVTEPLAGLEEAHERTTG